MAISKRTLKNLRLGKGWSQEQLTIICGLSQRTIQRIESNGSCSLESEMALAAAFSIPTSQLKNDGELSIFAVTEQSKKELARNKSFNNEALLSHVGDALNAGGWEIDLPSNDRFWTEQVKYIYEADQVLAISEVFQLYESSSRLIIEEAFDNLMEFGTGYDAELHLTTVKGNERWIRLTGSSVLQNKRIVKVRGAIQDITQLKK